MCSTFGTTKVEINQLIFEKRKKKGYMLANTNKYIDTNTKTLHMPFVYRKKIIKIFHFITKLKGGKNAVQRTILFEDGQDLTEIESGDK